MNDSAAARRKEILAWALLALLLYLLYRIVEPFFAPLTWEAVLSIFFFPAHRWIERLVRRSWIASTLSTACLVVLLIAPLATLAPLFVNQAIKAINDVPFEDMVRKVQEGADWLDRRSPIEVGDVGARATEAAVAIRDRAGGWTAKLAANFANFFIDSIVMVIALYFFFRFGPRLVVLLRDVSPFSGRRFDLMEGQAVEMIGATISAGLVVGGTQGALTALAFVALDIPSPIFWGVVTAVFSFIPFLGAWLIWLPAAIILMVNGDLTRGLILLGLGGGLVSTIDNFLRPMLIADRAQLNPLLVFIGVFGGIQAFGMIGLVTGPVLMATAVGLLRGYREGLILNREPAPES